MGNQTKTGVNEPPNGQSGSSPQTAGKNGGWLASALGFWQKQFGRPEPATVGDLVILPLGLAAIGGLITAGWSEATNHFLDPAFIGYSIGVNACIQLVILLPALALAFITRRKIWSGALLAIAIFWVLLIPALVHLIMPGADYRLGWCIGLLGAFQITRAINRHAHTRLTLWLVGVPALVALCALSYGRVREFSQLNSLPPPPKSPNVLIIIVDTLRADHLSPYGYSRDTSPYLTQLAQQGVLFENTIAPSSWTLPSHASMLTGLYPHQTQVETDMDDLSGNWPNLGDAMRKRGYRTAAFSANYQFFSKDHGFIQGFSHFEEYEQTIGGILEKVTLSRVILQYLSSRTTGDPFAFFGFKNAATAQRINKDAVNWMKRGDRPFFIVLNYFDLHEPVLPPEPWLHMYTSNPRARRQSLYFPDVCSWSEVSPTCDSKKPQYLDTYDGSIRYVDDSIKRLLSQLNEHKLLDNTIVVFTSDHGQEFGDHGIYGHGKSLYWREIQVPLIVWKPGLIPASVRVPTPVSTTDIPATILDLASPSGAANQPTLPGQSLAAFWHSSQPVSGWPTPTPELARLHWRTKEAPNYNLPVQSIVTPEWHYIRQENSDILFDWKTDPEETHDLCSAQPTVCSTLRGQIQTADGSRK